MKPTQILAKLCKEMKLEAPSYINGTVRIGKQVFRIQTLDHNNEWCRKKGNLVNLFQQINLGTRSTFLIMEDHRFFHCSTGAEEHMALAVLHHWREGLACDYS